MSKAPTNTASLISSRWVYLSGDCVVRREKNYGIRPACVQGPNKGKLFVSNEKFKFYISICRERIPCQKRSDGDQTAIPKISTPFW